RKGHNPVDGSEIEIPASVAPTFNTNTLVTKNLTFTKVWRDNNNENSMRPQNITADVYLGDTLIDSCTASASTSWNCTVTGLAVYDAKGNARSYLAKERIVPVGYETSDVIVTGKDTTAAELTNTLIVKNITVIKNWVDNKNFDSTRPGTITLKLYRDGSEFRSAIMSAAAHQFSDNIWIYTFEDIPEYNSSGSRASYTVKEFSAN
ncbi:MAG: Cna B-type domain-containing protein, partial [Anaerolineaceae bacterium]|nr:Cna B-type domain-containing protein [Anaerolineaceae bacterium]